MRLIFQNEINNSIDNNSIDLTLRDVTYLNTGEPRYFDSLGNSFFTDISYTTYFSVLTEEQFSQTAYKYDFIDSTEKIFNNFPTWGMGVPFSSSSIDVLFDCVFTDNEFSFFNIPTKPNPIDYFTPLQIMEFTQSLFPSYPDLSDYERFGFNRIYQGILLDSYYDLSDPLLPTYLINYETWASIVQTFPHDDIIHDNYRRFKNDLDLFNVYEEVKGIFAQNPNLNMNQFKFYLRPKFVKVPYNEGDSIKWGYYINGFTPYCSFKNFFNDIGYFNPDDLTPLFYNRTLSIINIAGGIVSAYVKPPLFQTQFYDGDIIEVPLSDGTTSYIFYRASTEEIWVTPEGFFYIVPINEIDGQKTCKLFYYEKDLSFLGDIVKDNSRIINIAKKPYTPPTLPDEQNPDEQNPVLCCLARCFGITN